MRLTHDWAFEAATRWFGKPAVSGAAAATEPSVRSCHDCGLAQRLPSVEPGMVARCLRCNATLRRTWSDSLDFALAANAASLVLLAASLATMLARISRDGQHHTAGLLSGPIALANYGLWELGVVVGWTTAAAPALVACLSLYVLVGVRLRRAPPWLRGAFILRGKLRVWSMVEVFLVGYFVAYAKLGALVHFELGPGFYALFAFMVTTIATDAVLDPQALWEAIDRRDPIHPAGAAPRATSPGATAVCCPACLLACEPAGPGAPCPRCGTGLERRKPNSEVRTAALVLAALVLYVPANVYPVLAVVQLGRGTATTILDGVWELVQGGQFPLAVIVFLASVCVPVLKLLALIVMLLVVRRGRSGHLPQLAKLYRVVATIGRWSMIDIFMESILSAVIKFGNLATITPGGGALAFAAVVILTLFAADSFDPRLMFDRAGQDRARQ